MSNVKFKIQWKCPNPKCKREYDNHFYYEFLEKKQKVFQYCDTEDGGCEQEAVIEIILNATVKVYELKGVENERG